MKTDRRLVHISNLLANYSMGNFDYQISLSENLDEIDSIISGINMLGEELRDTMVSRDFFSSVYNNVSNMLFIVDEKGKIVDLNSKAQTLIGPRSVRDKDFFALIKNKNEFPAFKEIRTLITVEKPIYWFECEFKSDFVLHAVCQVTRINDVELKGYVIVAEDVTSKKEADKIVLQAIIKAQESERKRVANDLHDSLGQELSSVKMMLGVSKKITQDPKQLEILNSTINILEDSIQDLRSLCFNLMPNILETGNLISAIYQLIEKTPIKIVFSCNSAILNINKEQEVSIYRVLQEFINNTLKHSQATYIKISMKQLKNNTKITVNDNGIGFDVEKDTFNEGRGLYTMKSRIESFGGKYELTSKLNQGVKLNITF